MKFFKLLPVFVLASLFFFSCGKNDKKPEYSDENTKNTLKQETTSTDNTEKKNSIDEKVLEEKSNENSQQNPADDKSQGKLNKESFQNEKPVAFISPMDADGYNGKTVTVKGFVADIYKSDKVAYLNFVEKFPKNPFTAVIFARQFEDFPDVTKFRGKDVEVTGRVSMYKGKPQIILNNPSQLKVK